jgi:proteasome accessory factor C
MARVNRVEDDDFVAAPDVEPQQTRRSRREINPAKEAADRVRLLLSIPPYLMGKKDGVELSRLARDFKISVFTADELIRVMAVSGIPGPDGMYMPYDLFDIDWDLFLHDRVVKVTNHVELTRAPRLTAKEAATLIAGLQYIEVLAGSSDKRSIKTLREKLSAGANVGAVNTIEIEPPPTPPQIEKVRIALESGTQLEISYQNADLKRSKRIIEPLRIDLVASSWYVRAFCHTRQDIMTFRIDRIIEATPVRRRRTTKVSPDDLGDELFDPPATGLFEVVLEMPVNTARLITEFAPRTLAGAKPGFTRVSVTIGSLRNLARVVSSMQGSIQVLSPPEAIRAVSSWANEALVGYPASKRRARSSR